MARKSPARVRAGAPRRLDQPVPGLPGLPGLSPRGRAAIVQLGRVRLWPGAAGEALEAWTRFLRDPYHRLFDPAPGCGVLACCPDPVEPRRLLHIVIDALPPRDARALRRRVAEIDARW